MPPNANPAGCQPSWTPTCDFLLQKLVNRAQHGASTWLDTHMPLLVRMLPILLLVMLTGCGSMPTAEGVRGQQVERVGGPHDHLLYLPDGYEPGSPVPVLLFLHGAGERGSELARVKVHGPPKLLDAGEPMPFIVISPLAPPGGGWEPGKLTALLDQIESEFTVDRSRIYVTGLSMGGFGTWALAAETPDRFAAIAPICGGGDPRTGGAIVGVPGVRAFHGARDSVVPERLSREMVAAVRDAGGTARLTVYPEAGHDSWTETYANADLYAWLLRHSREAE